MQRYLMPRSAKGGSLPLPDLGAFLKTYIFGATCCKAFKGRKALVKRKIVRSIGSLVTFIGEGFIR